MDQQQRLLGNIGWYSLKTGSTVQFDLLERSFKENDIKAMKVKAPSEDNIFRKGCSSIEVETSEGVLKTVKLEDTKVYLNRQIVLESDRGKKVLGTLRFNRRTKEVKLRKYGLIEGKYLAKLIDYIDLHKGKIDDSHLRQVIRDFLENKIDGLKMRSGVYFIEGEYTSKLNALAKSLNDVDGCYIFTVPLLDTPEQRQMLKVFLKNEFDNQVNDIYDLWKEVSDKDVKKVLVKDIEELKAGLKHLGDITYKAAMFTDKEFKQESLQDLNEIRSGLYKYEKSLEDI